ncbi:MAG TPA: hypothetical protein VJI15_02875 [Candidatus Nanoarchaeia archaeon]|nr:hypothetical protein [Candidatus Nanoarchaeia archaeon]
MILKKRREIMRTGTILLLLVFFLVSCSSDPQQYQEVENYKVGTKEVALTFVQDSPPKEVYQKSNFKVAVEVENLAAYQVEDVTLSLVGALDQYLQFHDPIQEVEGIEGSGILKGRSLTNPQGEKAVVYFDASAKELFLNADEQSLSFLAKVSYKSTVEFSETVCINPNLYDVYDSGCDVERKNSYSGQGAPVGVASMEEIIAPGTGGKVEFRLKVKNKGSGRVKSIDLTTAKLGGKEMRCTFPSTGTPHLEAVDIDEAAVVCEALLDTHSSYATSLFLDFAYDYVASEKHSLKIIK